MSENTQDARYCPTCSKLYALIPQDDFLFPIYETDNLNLCPDCKGELIRPENLKEENKLWDDKITLTNNRTGEERIVKIYFLTKRDLYLYRRGQNIIVESVMEMKKKNTELKGEIAYYQNKLKEKNEEIDTLKNLLDMDAKKRLEKQKKMRQCEFCGKLYLPKRKDQQFCKEQCRWNYYNQKKLEDDEACKNEKK